MSSGDPYDGDYLDYQDLTLPLDARLIFDAPPQHFQAVVYVKRQHELLDAAIHCWIRMARECQTDSLEDLEIQISLLAQGAARGPDGKVLEVRGSNWTHQQRLMQALFSVGPELQQCPLETLPAVLDFLGPMVLDPIHECCVTIEKTIKVAKLYCRQAIKLFETAIQKYHATSGKQKNDGSHERQIAQSVFDTKREMCKAIYALSGTLNLAIAFKENFILERTDVFLKALHTWQESGRTDPATLRSIFAGPTAETRRFSELMFPPVQFPLEEFKPYFGRYCHSLMLPLSFRDLENLEPVVPVPGQKAGYLFHRNRNGEWSRQYFYILPRGMLMQFSKGKDIHVANLNQTLLRTMNVDSRDFVFEICSIEIYLMESILQASTQVEYEEWKAAIFHWHPPDENIPHLETLAISTPPAKHLFPRPRYMSMGRAPEGGPISPKPRISLEYPVVKQGELYMLDVTSRTTNSKVKVGTWKRINCCIRSNGHFVQCNVGDKNENPFETIPLTETLRTHIWPIDGSLFGKKHCFSIKTFNDVNYYSVSLKRSSTDQEVFHSWLYALKSYAKPEVFGASDQLEYRIYRTFTIMVNDGRQLPPDLEAYCEIWLDDQKRAKTSTRMKAVKGGDPAPYWRDSFEFTDLTAFRVITIYVTQSKGSKNIPYGRTDIPIPSGEEREGWYPVLRVNERTRSNEFVGDLRLKLKCDEQIVLPLESYSEVLEILLNFRENNVISRLAELVTDLERFARNVLRILEGRGLAVLWLNSLIDEEIAEVNPMRVNTLFRGNTLLTKALDAYMRLVGTEYLDDTLGDILRNICKNKISCEVDPSKLEKNDDAAKQWRTLMTHTRACWKAVTDSVNNFPKELLQVFSHLQKRLTEKFSSHQRTTTSTTTTSSSSGVCDSDTDLAGLARYTGVSGFVFLRLICPAILGPKLFFIVGQHPEPKPHRTLTLIAKSLQGLANLVEFGQKEEWMKPMNLFIKENTPSLREFIDRICQPDPYTSGLGSSSNSIRSLPIVPPHSPGSTTSSMFRSQNKNGSIAGGSGNSSNGGGRENLAPLPSPSSLPRCSPRPPFCRDGLHPLGLIESGMLDSNQDIPLLPHLIDLGKELATFSTTVARVIPWMEVYSDDEDDESALATNGNGNGNGNGHNNVNRSGDHKKSIPNDRGPDDGQILVNDRRQEEDILRTLGRACWDLIHMIKDRVELSVELEQQARVRATNGGIHPHQQQQQKRQQQQCQYPQQQQQQNQQSPPSYSSKISCEGSRDGDFQLYSHDHYHGHIDHDDLDHSESYLKGGFDSDDESFGQTSGHEVV